MSISLILPLAATKVPLSTLLILGGAAAFVLIAWSYSHWRAAVKVAFVALLFEGAVRKWLLPQGQELAYFLKDVFLVGAYIRFFLAPDPELRGYRLRIPGALILALCAVVSLSALNPNIGSMILGAYGVKIYVFYIPLMFMMPFLFRTQDELKRNLLYYSWLGIPICLLGVLQWRSDTFSVMNTYAGGMDEAGATTFGFGNKARITGTFSYLTGHTTFVIFFGVLNLILLSWKETRRKWLIIGVSLPLLGANAFMGGSRASLFAIALVAGGFVLASFGGKVATSRQFLMTLIVGFVISCAGALYMFAEAALYWETRYHASADSFEDRVFGHTFSAVSLGLKEGGIGGFGIGTTHPATEAIRRVLKIAPPKRRAPVFDHEMGQVMVELGIFGFVAWYVLRIMLLFLAWSAFRQAPPGPLRSIALATVLVYCPYFLMSVVLNHTANFLIFGMLGLTMLPFLEPSVQRRVVRGQRVLNRPPEPAAEPAPLARGV
jgi:hypothetical protein